VHAIGGRSTPRGLDGQRGERDPSSRPANRAVTLAAARACGNGFASESESAAVTHEASCAIGSAGGNGRDLVSVWGSRCCRMVQPAFRVAVMPGMVDGGRSGTAKTSGGSGTAGLRAGLAVTPKSPICTYEL
jgi:hypothetical protein